MKQVDIQGLDEAVAGGLLELLARFKDRATCLAYLEAKRWPDGPVCPHCEGGKPTYRLNGKSHREGLHFCGACRRQFTVLIGTFFEGTHVPLPKWFAVIYLMCSSKKGISASQIHRSLKVTYKTAWYMCHRVRHAMRSRTFRGMLSGTVEIDETYVGGKASKHRQRPKPRRQRGRLEGKTIVLGMVERDGRARAQAIPNTKGRTLGRVVTQAVEPGSRVVTDDLRAYRGITAGRFEHRSIRHRHGIYVQPGGLHTNTIESFFALLKRGMVGTFHHVDGEYMDLYCGEFSYRYNTRELTDAERFIDAITHCGGRLRLA